MPGSILGNRVPRLEDPKLLVGGSPYVGDVSVEGTAHLVFVRSTAAHARILSIDTSEAARAPGVVAVFTADDLGLPPVPGLGVVNEQAVRPALAVGKVRFVGDMIATVIAETLEQAVDAAELVIVDYDPLPAVVDPEAALAPGAPLQFEEIGSNLADGYKEPGNPDVLAGSAHVTRLRLENQRIAVVPMEPNAILVKPGDDGRGHDLTVWVSTQMPHHVHKNLCKLLGLDPAATRVIAPAVGGAFGSKAGLQPEHVVVTAIAKRLDRPVLWTEDRSENMVATPHGRNQVDYIELGFDEQAKITGLRLRVITDTGAYAWFGGSLGLGPTRMMAQGVYQIPAISYSAAAAMTNTTPMGAFRGAGRPEAAELLERVMNLAADELGLDPVELRRRNLLANDIFPYTTKVGTTYDSGDYGKALDAAVEASGYQQLRVEQEERRKRGDTKLLGIGVAVYVEITGGNDSELGVVEIDRQGGATIRVGTSSHGQGHATSFAMIVSDRLGIPYSKIRMIQSDTAEVDHGGGTGGSRSLQIGGGAVLTATERILERAKDLAGKQLEADPADIVVTDDGRLAVAGVPTSAISWGEVAGQAETEGEALAATVDFHQPAATFPFGAHVSVVEVDRETGFVRPIRHIAVDDCGRILNPLIVNGQQHGGIAQGIAQALYEKMEYDEDGNPVTSTLAEYAMPSAAELPSYETLNTETPSPLNPLGAKGIGESGTIGSTPAAHNAVIDALAHLGVRHIDMPCTPEKVWQAIRAAEAGTLPPLWREPADVFSGLPDHEGDEDEEGSQI